MTNTQNAAERTDVAVLIDSIGGMLGTSDCDLVECIEVLTYVLGDAVAQTTDRKFSKAALSATMLLVTEAYSVGCTPDNTNQTVQ